MTSAGFEDVQVASLHWLRTTPLPVSIGTIQASRG